MQPTTTNTIMMPTTIPTVELPPLLPTDPEDAVEIRTRKQRFKMTSCSLDQLSLIHTCMYNSLTPLTLKKTFKKKLITIVHQSVFRCIFDLFQHVG